MKRLTPPSILFSTLIRVLSLRFYTLIIDLGIPIQLENGVLIDSNIEKFSFLTTLYHVFSFLTTLYHLLIYRATPDGRGLLGYYGESGGSPGFLLAKELFSSPFRHEQRNYG